MSPTAWPHCPPYGPLTLGGSRAQGTHAPASDRDFALYYRDGFDPAELCALGWQGDVSKIGTWGGVFNGGARLTIDERHVDVHYRDLGVVEQPNAKTSTRRTWLPYSGYANSRAPTRNSRTRRRDSRARRRSSGGRNAAAGGGVGVGMDSVVTETPARTVHQVFWLLGSGKTVEAAALFADSVDFSIPHAPGIPWIPEVTSAEGMRTFFDLLGTHMNSDMFEVDRTVADGADVVALGRLVSTVKATGREIHSAFAVHATVENGRITRYHMYEDSHAVAQAYFDT